MDADAGANRSVGTDADDGPDAQRWRAVLRGLDPHQREAVTTDAAPLAIVAAAGSGKTMVLT
ncbi:MAG: UvrD-helicase domain-containing protein, partial [Actinomycetes bacterium]